MTQPAHATFAACVGIDWADATHDSCLQAAGTAKRASFPRDHTPEALEAWGTTLRTRCSGHPVAVCLERTKGPLGSALRQDDFLLLFPLNPLTLARYRAAFTPSRAKDTPTDAALQLALLRTQRDQLQPLQPQSPPMHPLDQLVEHRRRAVGDKGQITNRLTSTLKNSCPHVLHGFQDKDTPIFWDFLRRWPPLKAAPRARRSTSEAKSEALTLAGRGTTERRSRKRAGGMGEKLPRSGLVQPVIDVPFCPDNTILMGFSGSCAPCTLGRHDGNLLRAVMTLCHLLDALVIFPTSTSTVLLPVHTCCSRA